MNVTFEDVKNNRDIKAYISKADESLLALGYTEHSFAHVHKVSELAGRILQLLGYDDHQVELAKIAGYLHDIGNIVNRVDHAQSGAVMAFRLLDRMNMSPEDIATVALIIADKTDVRRSRVRNRSQAYFDIHDRVNYSVTASKVHITAEEIRLTLTIDTANSTLMEYFEIFLGRMMLCKKAAEALNVAFSLIINGQQMM